MTTSSAVDTTDTRRHTPTEFDVLISDIVVEADGVRSLLMTPVAGETLPPWDPGAHVDLLLSQDLERQYSLCGNVGDRYTWRVAVLREPDSRGGSHWVHDRINVGDRVRVRGPRNNFALVDRDEYLFIAGGIGITPLLPMIARCEARGLPWKLVYGGRTMASMAFLDSLTAYGDKVTVWPQDSRGIIDLDALLGEPKDTVAVYCCGPGALLDAVEQRCATWPADALHIERFRPKAGALDGVNEAFDIELDSTGAVLTVGPTQSIVDVLEEANIEVPTSCREGTCGTCETVLFEGIPDHRDSYLTDQEKESNEVIMICCSRAKSGRLVLDL
jgi:ferredoxin-NADP reductase